MPLGTEVGLGPGDIVLDGTKGWNVTSARWQVTLCDRERGTMTLTFESDLGGVKINQQAKI